MPISRLSSCLVLSCLVATSPTWASLAPTSYPLPASSVDGRPLRWASASTVHGFSVSVRNQGIDLWKQDATGKFTNIRLEAIANLLTHIPRDGGCGGGVPGNCDDIFRVTYAAGTFGFENLFGEGNDPYHSQGQIAVYTQGNIANPSQLVVAAGNANATPLDEVAVLVEPTVVLVFEETGSGQLDPVPTVVTLPPGTQGDILVMADVTGDSKVELLVGSTTNGTITVMNNVTPFAQSTNFTFNQAFSVPGLIHFDATDMDGSGKADIVAARNNGATDEVAVALNTNGGTPFGAITSSVAVDAAPQMIASADQLPANGAPDAFVISNPSAAVSTLNEFTNGGAGSLVLTGSYSENASASWIEAANYEFVMTMNPVALTMTVYPMDRNGNSGLSPADEFVVGGGADPSRQATVTLRRGDGFQLPVSFAPYGSAKYGVKIGTGDINGTSMLRAIDEILTGPGPNPIYGPHVRAWVRLDNSIASIAKVSFFGYGTLKWGINVAGGSIDTDGPAEIITGPGPGAVFGPHLRAFNFDGIALSAISKVNAFCYGTLKYGLEVGRGDVDDDGIMEVLTGPGPGAMFPPQVRGWNFDGQTLTSIGKINFVAFSPGSYGCTVAGGDVDEDGIDEIAVGRGAGPTETAAFRAFNYDGASVQGLPGFSGTMGSTGMYGCRVGLANVGGTVDDLRDEVVAGHGPDSTASTTVEVYLYDDAGLTAGVSFDAIAGATYGVNAGAGALAF